MHVHSITIELALPTDSLKGKRGIVKSILARARHRFNVAAAEVDLQDVRDTAVIAFVTVTESRAAGPNILRQLAEWIAEERPDVEILMAEIEER
ncbi:MAG: DUF503 domain-containing protein [Geobacter sp.]|nr:DUF503 domain-containing protein [Geobacter sp.]